LRFISAAASSSPVFHVMLSRALNRDRVHGRWGRPRGGGIQIPSGARKLAEGPPRKAFFAPKGFWEHSARFPCLRPLPQGLRCSVSRSGHAAVVQFLQRATGTVLLHNYEQGDARVPSARGEHHCAVHTSLPFCSALRWVYSFLTDSPLSSMRWAPCTMRSQMASAMVGSPIVSCQLDTGS